MRDSRNALVLVLAALAGAGCSARTIAAVDPYPRAEGGAPDGADGAPDGAGSGLLDDLVGFWHLNDPSGSTTARDWSGWSNDGTLVGLDGSTAWAAGGPTGAALTTRIGGHVSVPASASIDSISREVTLAAWMYVDSSLGDYATAISRQFAGGLGQHYHLACTKGWHATMIITPEVAGNQKILFAAGTIAPETWTHIAGTYDGTQMRIYVNGEAAGSMAQSGAFAPETNPVILSGNANGDAGTVSEEVPGQLTEVMLYRRALSPDEIVRIYQGALRGPSAGARDAGGN